MAPTGDSWIQFKAHYYLYALLFLVFDVEVLFLLPFVLYAFYLWLSKFDAQNPRHAHPWAGLYIAGLAMVVAGFFYWGLTEGGGLERREGAPAQSVYSKFC